MFSFLDILRAFFGSCLVVDIILFVKLLLALPFSKKDGDCDVR